MEQHSRVRADIDLDAVLYNMASMRANIGARTKMMAVVKADGYGHGAAEIARTIEPLDYLYGFAVATVEEALSLRTRHEIKKPILILGYVFPELYEQIVRADIMPTVFTYETAREISDVAKRLGKKCPVHVAVDTGMGRIGYPVTETAADEIARIAGLSHVAVEGIFTHFARADERDKSFTRGQLEKFEKMIAMTKERGLSIPFRHCANSAGIVELREANMDMVRAGITLYGLWPSDEVARDVVSLRPVLSLKSHIAYVKTLEAGSPISYGGTYVTARKSVIATIPVGYADGYCRGLSNKGSVLIRGKRAPICGRICMDQFMADVTDIPGAAAGDEVTLIGADGGERITLEELGSLSGRFNYEFACDLGKRIPRVFYRDGVKVGESFSL